MIGLGLKLRGINGRKGNMNVIRGVTMVRRKNMREQRRDIMIYKLRKLDRELRMNKRFIPQSFIMRKCQLPKA
jgi:hypothetical protein